MYEILSYLRFALSLDSLEKNLALALGDSLEDAARDYEKRNPEEEVPRWYTKKVLQWLVRSIVTKRINRAGIFDPSDIADLFQTVTYDFYRRGRVFKDTIRHTMDGGNPRAYLGGALKNGIKSSLRDFWSKQKRMRPTDDLSILEREHNQGPAELLMRKEGDRVVKELFKDMRTYVLRKMNKPLHKMLFDQWMRGIKKNGTHLNLMKDVVRPVAKTTGYSEKGLYSVIYSMRDLLERFFKESGMDFPKEFDPKRFGSESIADRVAARHYRSILAAWVLH